jgi:hypothetical protein
VFVLERRASTVNRSGVGVRIKLRCPSELDNH